MLRRHFTVVLGGTAVLLLLVAVAAVLLLPSTTPTVPRSAGIEVTDVERALSLARSHDPRRALPGVVRTLRLSGHEAELLLNQAAARLGAGAWQVDVAAARLRVRGSVPLPRTPLGHWWLNVDVVAHATRGGARAPRPARAPLRASAPFRRPPVRRTRGRTTCVLPRDVDGGGDRNPHTELGARPA